MPKESREVVDVTAALKNILDSYPAGSASLREILQNTDDAGAKTQTFILDTRTFGAKFLVDPVLSVCQGPAILATNDAHFKPQDWKAIKTILNSSKKQDEASTGKYGLGFRSCYHITDNPHILSNDQLHIFDPHQRTKKYTGGFYLPTHLTPDEDGLIDRRTFKDHFSTFSAVLKPEDDVYSGTAIRLPLRLPGPQSKIKSTPTSVADARNMINDFIKNELPEAMLFLKNIREIILKEIDQNGDETILATAKMENTGAIASQWSGVHARRSETSHNLATITLRIGSALPLTSSWILTHFVEKYETASAQMARRLNRPQSEVEADMVTDKLLPQVALALPLPQEGVTGTSELHGQLFTLLPLPIVTNFPLHINAVLALVSDRQHLRNSHDVTAGSREELLVEWNRVIFSEFVPKAWASLLHHLVTQPHANSSGLSHPSINVLEAWPNPVTTQDGAQGYWHPVPARLLEEAASKAVWPLYRKSSQFSTLNDVLVVMAGDTAAPLAPLEACNVPLVVVPEGVFKLIEKSEFKKAILSPETSYPYLKKNFRLLSNLDDATKESICDYLVSAKDIRIILDLPIIPQVQKKYTSITSHGKYIMATESEALALSNADPNLLAAESMSDATRQLLLSDPAGRVRPVDHADVVRYLEDQVPTFGRTTLVNITTGVNQTTFNWLVKFWSWLDGWEKLDQLVNDSPSWSAIQNLHALPIRLSGGKRALRLVGKSAIRPESLDGDTVAALTALEIPVLDWSMSNGSAVQRVSESPSDVAFILQILPKNKSFSHLDQKSRQTLHEFFTEQLSDYLQSRPRAHSQTTLNAESRNTLRTLPIFPIINPGLRDNNSVTFDVAPGGACFVDDGVQVIPNIRGVPFVSHDQGRILHTALDERDVLGEIAVLQKAISPDAWSQQDRVTGLLSALIDRLITRLNELGDSTRSILAELPIVEVGGRAGRQSLSQVVDPASDLAGLYDVEDRVIPIGEFAKEGPGSNINQLRNYGLIRNALTPSAIRERVARISDQSRPMEDRSTKASRLLGLLDSYTQSEELPAETVDIIRDSAWLPVADEFFRPSECWDSRTKDTLLCDLVLPRISFTVNNHHLRDCLGWTRVPFGTLQYQLIKVLETESRDLDLSETEVVDRIEAVLEELASEWHASRVSHEQIESMLDALGDSAWVPYSSRDRCAGRQSMLEQIDLGTKYHTVSSSLLRVAGMEAFLEQMGIPSRPSPASLYSTLREISKELSETDIAIPTRNTLVHTSILILGELCRSIEGEESEVRKILVPTEACQLVPAPEVLFNDMGGDPTGPLPGFQFAHSQISPSLANTLGLRRLSEEDFSSEGDDIQSWHMEEDLTVRIRKVLQDYDIDHSSNEWVANADDAGATSVTFLIDEASFQGRRVIGGLTDFQSGPALVVHNDGVFTDADFEGLGNIGRGGKAGRVDSIGRFGLGALSFYHFSELPWIISGKYCLFLDPSKQYLPREKGNVKRSAARIPLSFCITRYPDQLKPLDGLFGFSSKDEEYNGTIFRFPLRTKSQADPNKLSGMHFSAGDVAKIIDRFYSYASQSLFFTKSIAEIAALHRTADLKTSPVWFVTSSRETISHHVQDMAAIKLSLKLKGPHTPSAISEHWLVTTGQATKDGFPPRLQPLFDLHRLPTPTCGLAVHLSAKSSVRNSRLFATLPLPVSISLPVHVHATWILAQDRRSIRYDAPDAANQRPLDTEYNEHILEKAIVPLYVKTLALVLAQHPGAVSQFWPEKAQDGPSRIITTGLYKQIIVTKEPVLLTVQNKPIAPSQAIIHVPKSPLAVRKVLSEIRAPNYVPEPFFNTSFLKDWGGLRFDTAAEVSKILREHADAVRELCQIAKSTSAAFTLKDVLSILDYLLKEGESLVGIPLLLRGDRKLVEFQDAGQRKIFASHRADLAKLFGSSTVLSPEISESFAQNLVKLNVNVVTLNSQGMRELLATYSEAITPADMKATTGSRCDWSMLSSGGRVV